MFYDLKDAPQEIVDIFSRLSETQLMHYYEPKPGLFIAEGILVVERALKAGYVPKFVIADRKRSEVQDRALLERMGEIPIYLSEPEDIRNILGFKMDRGPMCAMERKVLWTAEEVCENATRIAVLERVTNPTNVGAIVRSAAALGMDGVLLTRGCSDPLYRRAQRVSMGTIFQIPWGYLEGSVNTNLSFLQERGFSTAAMALRQDSVSIGDPRLNEEEKLAVILGEEGYGLCDETIDGSDYTVLIPMAEGVDSLNVAAASAVAFWQCGKKK